MEALIARFKQIWETLNERARRWVRSGKITLKMAKHISKADFGWGDLEIKLAAARRHGAMRVRILLADKNCGEPIPDDLNLIACLRSLSQHALQLFIEGDTTLTEVRFADRFHELESIDRVSLVEQFKQDEHETAEDPGGLARMRRLAPRLLGPELFTSTHVAQS